MRFRELTEAASPVSIWLAASICELFENILDYVTKSWLLVGLVRPNVYVVPLDGRKDIFLTIVLTSKRSPRGVLGMEVDLSGIEAALNSGFSTFETLAILTICIVGSAIGWKKVLPGLSIFVIYALATNNESVETNNFISLIVLILLWCGIGAAFKWVRNKMRKKKADPVSVNEEFEPENSVALAKTH